MRAVKGLAIALVLVLGLGGCAATQIDKGMQAVTAGAHVLTDGEDALRAADQAIKSDLLAKVSAGTLTQDEAESLFSGWVAKRTRAVKALTTLWDAMKTAAHSLSVAEAIKGQPVPDFTKAVSDLIAAISSALQALTDAGVKVI